MKGTLANLVIWQGAEEQYKPTLYSEPTRPDENLEPVLNELVKQIQSSYPGVELKISERLVVIPEKYKEGHEPQLRTRNGEIFKGT